MILTPAILDTWRYFHPDARWPRVAVARGESGCRATDCPRDASGLVRAPKRERHRAFDDDLAVDPRDAAQLTHAAAQAPHDRFDLDDVAGMHGAAVAHALDAHEKSSFSRFSGFARIRIAPTWAMASVRIVGGSTGASPARCARYRSLSVTFLMPTIRLSGSSSVMRSTSRNG